jgi:hypothetical protein
VFISEKGVLYIESGYRPVVDLPKNKNLDMDMHLAIPLLLSLF